MTKRFDHQKAEKKWWKIWQKQGIYKARDFSKKPKFYGLIEFPYPSGEGLHIGHPRSFTAMDVISRKRRMQGYNVLYPIGWDAFGLPTENYAVKTGIHPKIVTKRNTDTFRRQLQSLGFSFDWTREINTTDPKYYRWTQWIFLQLFKHGLAYKKKMPINWCPSCKIGLANEEVITHSTSSGQVGKCERCGNPVETREKEQWLLAITKYADRLLFDLDKVDYLDRIKIQQKNWIGKSEGSLLCFNVVNDGNVGDERKQRLQRAKRLSKRSDQAIPISLEVFTTRPDTLFGATYMVLAPEHPLAGSSKSRITNYKEVEDYIRKARKKTELQRTDLAREKTGVELKGLKAINPANGKEIPIWMADYVLSGYGTGAIMAVPAHDERDFEFARQYKLPVVRVVKPAEIISLVRNAEDIAAGAQNKIEVKSECWTGSGNLINSGKFSGMDSEKAKWEIVKFVRGKKQSQYHLRDWIFSRQRYWGEPIPLVFCSACAKKQAERSTFNVQRLNVISKGELLNPGWIPMEENKLPVKLPDVKNYKPADTGESPLATMKSWVNTKCPRCGGPARRETDTMPNWAGSSWYFLRYADPQDNRTLADFKKLKYWAPVDWYNGGMEHTTLHLLYSRFWNKFLYDIGVVPVPEPYKKRTSHGMILGGGGEKMSKSKGNVINPDALVREFGADAVRVYEMFMGPFDQAIAWDHHGLIGVSRFLNRVWEIGNSGKIKARAGNRELEGEFHRVIKKVSEDIESMSFNTAVSSLMIISNHLNETKEIPQNTWEGFLALLAPFAPYMTEELWNKLGNKKSIHVEAWPIHDPDLIVQDKFELVIQVNGKVRDKVLVSVGIRQNEAEKIVLNRDKIKAVVGGRRANKIIFVPNRLINIVIN